MTARFGAFALDSDQRQLTRGGMEVHLTPKAFDLLLLLIEGAPRVHRKNELHERLWPGTFVADATLVGLVKELRRALEDSDASAPIIRTAHRVGYAFVAPLQRVHSSSMSRWVIAGSRRIPLTGGETIIGRDPASTIYLDAAGVSRCHARIVVDGKDVLLEDLGSKNGTIVGGNPLTGRRALRDGDEIRIGPVSIVYRASPRGVSTETTNRVTSRGPQVIASVLPPPVGKNGVKKR